MGRSQHLHVYLVYKMKAVYLPVIMLIIHTVLCDYCPPFVNEGVINNTKQLGNMDYSCQGERLILPCCVSGKDVEIKWLMLVNLSWNNPLLLPGYVVQNDNQSLVIEKTGKKDGTTFKCIASNNRDKSFENSIILKTVICSSQDEPISIPVNKTVHRERRPYGQNVTFQCLGFFGHDDNDEFRSVDWHVMNGSKWINVRDITRYKTSYWCNYDNSQCGVNLTIPMMQKADIREYRCWLSNGGLTVKVKFFLDHDDRHSRTDHIGILTISAFIAVMASTGFMVIVVGLILLFNSRFRIKIWYKKRFKHQDIKDGIEHDITLLHGCGSQEESHPERQFVIGWLRSQLEQQLHFICKFPERDFQFGTVELEEYYKISTKGKCSIIVVSPAMLENEFNTVEFNEFAFHQALNAGRKIIFILFEDVSNKQWCEYTAHRKNNSMKNAMKIIPTMKWRSSKRSWLKKWRKESFLLELRSHLPPQPSKKSCNINDKERLNSGRPLLEKHVTIDVTDSNSPDEVFA